MSEKAARHSMVPGTNWVCPTCNGTGGINDALRARLARDREKIGQVRESIRATIEPPSQESFYANPAVNAERSIHTIAARSWLAALDEVLKEG